MYAIVRTGGKQYRVERGQTLLVERLPGERGTSVALEPVLYRSDELVLDKAALQKVQVSARVLGHERGEKLRVFKFKPKRGYRRRTGHRQELTRIEVIDISMSGVRSAAKPAAARAPKSARAATKPSGVRPSGARSAGIKPSGVKPAGAKPARAKPAAAKRATNKKKESGDGS